MIAKVKATGEIIDVEYNDGWIRKTEPQSWIRRDEIEILGYTEEEVKQRIDRAKKDHIDDYLEKLERGEYDNSNIEAPDWHGPHRIMTTEQIATQPFASISDENYWRRMYAGMAMQGILPRFNPASYCVCSNESEYEFVAVEAAKYADALIEALKKENKDDTH